MKSYLYNRITEVLFLDFSPRFWGDMRLTYEKWLKSKELVRKSMLSGPFDHKQEKRKRRKT
jgi:hypothetical protein